MLARPGEPLRAGDLLGVRQCRHPVGELFHVAGLFVPYPPRGRSLREDVGTEGLRRPGLRIGEYGLPPLLLLAVFSFGLSLVLAPLEEPHLDFAHHRRQTVLEETSLSVTEA